ncbi:MAG: sodium:proton antiporter NhaD [Porticoccaceae bacterium]|nr:sodium:proton antiporter NhaD [Porticoccaceae bacterium]
MIIHSLLILLAVMALLGVVFEEKIHINKAKTTLFCGTLAWVILFITAASSAQSAQIKLGLTENITDIASLWLFLLAAMTFVAYLNKKGMIENLIYLFLPKRISEKKLLFLTAIFCFLFSSLADNITATLCSVALILSLQLSLEKTIRFAVVVVFAVNSGGVALITGDVTTLMIFLADRVRIEDLLFLSLPSFIAVMVLAGFLSRGLDDIIEVKPHITDIRKVDISIAAIFLLTILGTIGANIYFDIPPVLSFLFGLSLMFLTARFFNEDIDEDPIMDYIRLIEFDTLMFFLGVLLVVGMLREIQVLNGVIELYSAMPHGLANFAMGILSAIIDNVPLTAALLKSGIEMNDTNWLLLTYSVGVGGSLLIIGSAAGIVAMSKIPSMTFNSYLRFLIPLFTAYCCGFAGAYLLGMWLF